VSALFTLISETRPRCSFKEPSMIYVWRPMRQTLTSPSWPPDTIFWQSLVPEIAVTPWLWASFIAKSNFPDYGKKARIFPSLQPERTDFPSLEKKTQKHSSPGTSIRKSSCLVLVFQMRMSLMEQVAKSSEYPVGKAISLMRS